MDKIQLRKFPYPYEAALTICSDIDGTSFDDFLVVQKFINSRQKTPLGNGLGLPIGNSFWMYDHSESSDSAFSYFSSRTFKPTRYAPYIRELIKSGILDVIHSYGDFNEKYPFTRKLAEQSIEELEKHGLKVSVWTNHGGPENYQNIGRLSSGKGDINQISTNESLNYYHADLLLNYGIKFYWDSEINVTNIVGQDCPGLFLEAYWNNPLYGQFEKKYRQFIKGGLSIFDFAYYQFFKKNYFAWATPNIKNDLIIIDRLHDNQYIYKFKRFGHGRYDWSEDMHALLNDNVLERLLEKQGYLILYIHLGAKKEINKYLLHPETIMKFKQISNYYQDGRIWIDTTANLLQYNLIQKNLKWHFRETDTKLIIEIDGIMNPDVDIKLDQKILSGLTFDAPLEKDITILFNNKEIECDVFRTKDAQHCRVLMNKIDWPF